MDSFTPDPMIGQSSGFIPDSSIAKQSSSGLTSDQQAMALGHSNGLIGNILSGAQTGTQNFAKGFGEATLTTLGNTGTAIEGGLDQTLGRGINAAMGKGFTPTNTAASSAVTSANPALQPQGLMQKIGAGVSDIGQFFLPGGAEEGLAAKGAEAIDKLPDLMGLTGKAADAVTGALKTALKSATAAGTFGGVTAAQTGGKDVGGAATLGAATGGLSGVLDTFGQGLGEALQKADFKLSPAQESKAVGRVDSAAKFMTQNGILGSDSSKFAKLTQLNSSLEGALQSSLSETLKVSKDAVVSNINSTVEQLKTDDPAIYQQARSSADKAIDLMKNSEGDTVGLKEALSAKRSYGQAAFKQSKFAVRDPNVVSEGSFAVEQGFQKALSDTMDTAKATIKVPSTLSKYFNGAKEVPLSDFNKVYSNAITSKNLTSMARFKNDSGLFGRFFGLWAGESIGQMVSPGLGGKIVGGAVGEMASQAIPGFARGLGERAVSAPGVAEGSGKIAQGVENQ